MKDYRLVMDDGELRLRMKPELKKAVLMESRKRSDLLNKRVSMNAVIISILQMKFKTNKLKRAILEESRMRTDKCGIHVSMNSIVNEILESTLLKKK